MADNYLERKMAERASGRSVQTPSRRRGMLSMPFAPQRIAVTGCECAALDALLTTLRQTGSVAEYCATSADVEALGTRLGSLDLTINIADPQTIEISAGEGHRTVSSPDPEALARLAAFMSAPANRSLHFTLG